MSLPAYDIDFSRYAPERPQLAIVPTIPTEPDELAVVAGAFGEALRLLGRCIAAMTMILWWRAARWLERRILRSLSAAWSLAGLGWGGFGGLVLFTLFLR
jgi:hypothetical protein